jgi:hypothetical protein
MSSKKGLEFVDDVTGGSAIEDVGGHQDRSLVKHKPPV